MHAVFMPFFEGTEDKKKKFSLESAIYALYCILWHQNKEQLEFAKPPNPVSISTDCLGVWFMRGGTDQEWVGVRSLLVYALNSLWNFWYSLIYNSGGAQGWSNNILIILSLQEVTVVLWHSYSIITPYSWATMSWKRTCFDIQEWL